MRWGQCEHVIIVGDCWFTNAFKSYHFEIKTQIPEWKKGLYNVYEYFELGVKN
jgi:hypothetical protein